jgi:uncharacterized protein YjbI with pentapeptide repeats
LGDLSSLDGYDLSKTMAALGLVPGDFINLVMADVWRRDAGSLPAPTATAPAPPVIKADLSGANLHKANLERAGMVGANLRFANLTQVCFNQAYTFMPKSMNTTTLSSPTRTGILVGASHLQRAFWLALPNSFRLTLPMF